MDFNSELDLFKQSHFYKTVNVDGINYDYLLCGNDNSEDTLVYLIGGLGLSFQA